MKTILALTLLSIACQSVLAEDVKQKNMDSENSASEFLTNSNHFADSGAKDSSSESNTPVINRRITNTSFSAPHASSGVNINLPVKKAVDKSIEKTSVAKNVPVEHKTVVSTVEHKDIIVPVNSKAPASVVEDKRTLTTVHDTKTLTTKFDNSPSVTKHIDEKAIVNNKLVDSSVKTNSSATTQMNKNVASNSGVTPKKEIIQETKTTVTTIEKPVVPVHEHVTHLAHRAPTLRTPIQKSYQKTADIDLTAPVVQHTAALPSISTQDIVLDITRPTANTFNVVLKDKSGRAISHDSFVPLTDGSDFSAHTLDTRLTYIKSFNAMSDNTSTTFNYTDNKIGKCSAFYFTYHLKGDKGVTTKHVFIDNKGMLTDSSVGNCHIPDGNTHDTINFGQSSYITTVSWMDSFNSSHRPVNFKVFVTKDGFELAPHNLFAYAVSADFKTFVYSAGIENKKGAYYGQKFSQILPAGSYFMNISFDHDAGTKNELITIPTIVQ